MKNLLNPKWLIIVNTIPILFFFFILAGDFRVIRSLLDDENIFLWWLFGGTLALLALLNLVYAGLLIYKKKIVSGWYSALSLVAYIAYIYVYVYNINDIIPFRIPDWMMSGNIFIYACTFLMPTLVYSLFSLVVHLTANPKTHKAWLNFLIMVLVPVFVYLFFLYVLPLWDSGYIYINEHFYITLFIVCTLIFLFFLMRSFYILVSKKSRSWSRFALLWKIPFTIIFPIMGLTINNGFLDDRFWGGTNVFGDLSNIWFYILALVNGILLCLPNIKKLNYRIPLFLARCITLSYSFYFFIVFLPYLPLSILAILAIGIGFLMLSPLVLFVIHVNEIYQDIQFLRNHFSKRKIVWAVSLGFLIIPIIMSTVFLRDKMILNSALEYVYSSNYDKENFSINTKSLISTLYNIEKQKRTRSDILFFNYTPYISSYYNWLVLDNLTLSNEKISRLREVFYDYSPYTSYDDEAYSVYYNNDDNIPSGNDDKDDFTGIKITDTKVESYYDESRGGWVSWVHLEITNFSNSWWLDEYETNFKLPDGCWISDYYLYVEDKKEPGILSEKKSAMWVFSQIRDENKDPGILHYTSGNNIKFKVFPFSTDEVRKTGIEFIHKEPVHIKIDDHELQLGNPEPVYAFQRRKTDNEYINYVSIHEKKELNEIMRNSYFHFIVNTSADMNEYRQYFTDEIEKLMSENLTLAKDAKISFVDTYIKTISANKDWKNIYAKQNFTGGFFIERAIKSALFQAYNENAYPVIVVLNDRGNLFGLSDSNFEDFKFIFPESDKFYSISPNNNSNIKKHSLIHHPSRAYSDTLCNLFTPKSVLEYRHDDGTVSYVSKEEVPSILFRKKLLNIPASDIKERNLETALLLQANWLTQQLYPETSDKEWVKLALNSFDSGIMTPVTSYIVVENEAQKAAMLRKQKQVLASNKDYDTMESIGLSSSMSEPDIIIMVVLLLGFIIYKRSRRVRYTG